MFIIINISSQEVIPSNIFVSIPQGGKSKSVGFFMFLYNRRDEEKARQKKSQKEKASLLAEVLLGRRLRWCLIGVEEITEKLEILEVVIRVENEQWQRTDIITAGNVYVGDDAQPSWEEHLDHSLGKPDGTGARPLSWRGLS